MGRVGCGGAVITRYMKPRHTGKSQMGVQKRPQGQQSEQDSQQQASHTAIEGEIGHGLIVRSPRHLCEARSWGWANTASMGYWAPHHGLGDLIAQALRERDPKASPEQLAQARDKALRAPCLLLMVVDAGKVRPERASLVSAWGGA
jgi:hypothetical protein